MPTPGTVLACFYAGSTIVDLGVREVTRRPGQPLGDVPSHCALIVSPAVITKDCGDTDEELLAECALYEMTARGWVKRIPTMADIQWSYSVALPDIDACRLWCRANTGRYRWWVDGVIGLMALRLVRHRRVGPFVQGHLHLAYRHICSLDMLRSMIVSKWACPQWLAGQDAPASPNDILLAVRETQKP